MADKKNNILSLVNQIQNAWKKAEKLKITQNRAEDALLILTILDESGSHQTTRRLAGKATHKIAQQTNAKSDYRINTVRDSKYGIRNPVEHTMICSMKMQEKRISGVRLI